MFVCLLLKSTINIEVLGLRQELELSFAEGMMGCLPIFDTKEKAEAYIERTGKIIEIREIKEIKNGE